MNDHKVEIGVETAGLSKIFPDLSLLELNLDEERGKDCPLSKWSKHALILLQGKLESYQFRRSKRYQNKLIKDQVPCHKVVEMFNSAFGHSNWSTEIISTEILSKEEGPNYSKDPIKGEEPGKDDTVISLTIEMTLRIKLKDGTYHDQTSQANVKNYTIKSQAFNNCRKIAYSNCLKESVFEFRRILLEHEDLLKKGLYMDHNVLVGYSGN
ncbi:hypothetical protein WICPIJ_003840 [Wickerhamomyces pijperi]|uniref:DNA repair and recombination protein RAD52 n=1 Tax=Wickerhamomyces pijperi TaxID=599730 RepID=A0A9P8Q950_WICPI|nr:hypothetical protein WICPIJ_003840 [Wickerhamomyces pijperi]